MSDFKRRNGTLLEVKNKFWGDPSQIIMKNQKLLL